MNKISKLFAFIILFLIGYDFVVPVDVTDPQNNIYISLPFWAQKIQIIHGLYLKDLLFIIYILYLFIEDKTLKLFVTTNVKVFTLLIFALGTWGIVSTFVNQNVFLDYFEASRILLLSLFFLICFNWAISFGTKFVLKYFLLGSLISTLINLSFTFVYSWKTIGILPVLLGQNGPGSALGFMINLSAYLFFIKKNRTDSLISILFLIFGTFAIIISFSKLGMLMGFLGIISWVFIIFSKNKIQVQKGKIISVSLILSIIIWINYSNTGNKVGESISKIYELKLGEEEGVISLNDTGDLQRIYYFYAVGEIFINNVLFGVGYSGFKESVLETEAYKSGFIIEDEDVSGSNPHNSFLYYASANGIFGLIIITSIFIYFSITVYKSFNSNNLTGFVISVNLILSALIFGNTTVGLFSTHLLYVTMAVFFSSNIKDHYLINN